MPIQLENGFLATHDLGITSCVGIESGRLSACVDAAKSFDGIFGSPCFGFKEQNLDFLGQLNHLRQVWFWDCHFSSIEGLYALQNLEYAGLMKKRPGIDYSRFPRLNTVVAHWGPKDSFEFSSIKKMSYWHCTPRSKSFEGICFPSEIEELDIYWSNPASLSGIPPMRNLRSLSIHRSKLEDISALATIAPNLKQLIIETSKKIPDHSPIEAHPTIELGTINDTFVKGLDPRKQKLSLTKR